MFLHNRFYTHFHWIIGKDRNHDIFTSLNEHQRKILSLQMHGEPVLVSHANWNAVEIVLMNSQPPSPKPTQKSPKAVACSWAASKGSPGVNLLCS